MNEAKQYAIYLLSKFDNDKRHASFCVDEIIRQNERLSRSFGEKFTGTFWIEVKQWLYDTGE